MFVPLFLALVSSAWAVCVEGFGPVPTDICEANLRRFWIQRAVAQPGELDKLVLVPIVLWGAQNEDGGLTEPNYPHTFEVTLEKLAASDPTTGVGSTALTITADGGGSCTDTPSSGQRAPESS